MTARLLQSNSGSSATTVCLPQAETNRQIKCVVWDLDNTVWCGTLLENDLLSVSDDVINIIRQLDNRGILQSIASKNDYACVKKQLQEFGLWEYFLYPQVSWEPKSAAIREIARALNISLDTFAFIDDQEFELREVGFALPQVLLINSQSLPALLQLASFNPESVTRESAERRDYYRAEQCRSLAEEAFDGPNEAFLASLNMSIDVCRAGAQDLQRAGELTRRTHQLNTTGYTYSQSQLQAFCESDNYLLLLASLSDDFGRYGTIGLVLIEKKADFWQLNLFLMSCRVVSRGIGNVLLGIVMRMAKKVGVSLRAEFIANPHNRLMYITYRFNGFSVLQEQNEYTLFEHPLKQLPILPAFIKVSTPELDDIR
ncbi:HAD-IIIC family phosphatase [Pantoea sp. B65]|uniref:HAD-IIIC family phosphatase n=1 Tax=Pantoea sp. B65 TaxID=2813359 RepID=UPI0039B50879